MIFFLYFFFLNFPFFVISIVYLWPISKWLVVWWPAVPCTSHGCSLKSRSNATGTYLHRSAWTLFASMLIMVWSTGDRTRKELRPPDASCWSGSRFCIDIFPLGWWRFCRRGSIWGRHSFLGGMSSKRSWQVRIAHSERVINYSCLFTKKFLNKLSFSNKHKIKFIKF